MSETTTSSVKTAPQRRTGFQFLLSPLRIWSPRTVRPLANPTPTICRAFVRLILSPHSQPNGEHQRWDGAATDARTGSELNGSLPSAECSGWVSPRSYVYGNDKDDLHRITNQRESVAIEAAGE